MKLNQPVHPPIDQCRTAAACTSRGRQAPAPQAACACDSLSTEELAALLKLKPQTLRKRYAQTGAYFGVRPQKLANRRLLWPADAVSRLAGIAQ